MNESILPTSELYLRLYPDEALRNTCTPFPDDMGLRADVARQMIDLMYHHNGLGLSAPQVGLSQSVFVMRSPTIPKVGLALFNPSFKPLDSVTEVAEEGCLSLLGKQVKIRRFKEIEVTFERIDSSKHTVTYKDLTARCVQHEMDHLNGVLIFDHINNNLAQKLFLEKYYKAKKKYVRLG